MFYFSYGSFLIVEVEIEIKIGPMEILTRIAGFRVLSANMGPIDETLTNFLGK